MTEGFWWLQTRLTPHSFKVTTVQRSMSHRDAGQQSLLSNDWYHPLDHVPLLPWWRRSRAQNTNVPHLYRSWLPGGWPSLISWEVFEQFGKHGNARRLVHDRGLRPPQSSLEMTAIYCCRGKVHPDLKPRRCVLPSGVFSAFLKNHQCHVNRGRGLSSFFRHDRLFLEVELITTGTTYLWTICKTYTYTDRLREEKIN